MHTLKTWFKGSARHEEGAVKLGSALQGPGHGASHGDPGCLWLVTETREEVDRLVAIGQALFPERWCDCTPSLYQLIHFNNSPLTTQDHVEKILHTYHLEH